ncbi:MAG: MBL fold metallo-hydrolase [Capsulimonadales bacterium]|nr:MBL fold metallo-hydrolase [Capsulimonadales bacterium]
MTITWYGHAAFLLEGRNADGKTVRIGLDPYQAPLAGTYAPIDDLADVVAVSHENAKYHSFTGTFRNAEGDPSPVVDGLSLLGRQQPETVAGVPLTAVRVWENDRREEPIAMIGLMLESVRVLHMGDCGHALSPEEVAACGPVDVLLALAGGPPTLTLTDLVGFVRDLRPRVVVPMHFGNDKINLRLQPLSDFLARVPPEWPVRSFETSAVTVTPETLPESTEVWVLPPAR